MSTTLLLSVYPPIADAILEGRKTLEIRRVRLRQVVPGTRVVLYATESTGVVGEADVRATAYMPPDLLWRRYKDQMGVFDRRRDFMDYVGDLDKAMGLFLESPARLDEAIPLPSAIKAPQSYAYLSDDNPLHQLLLRKLPDRKEIA